LSALPTRVLVEPTAPQTGAKEESIGFTKRSLVEPIGIEPMTY
jgi:hypothetical protein